MATRLPRLVGLSAVAALPAMRRNGVATASLAAFLLGLSACSSTNATVPRQPPVRMANLTGGPFARELVAQYRRTSSNLDVQLVEVGGPSNLESLVRGEADITIGGADSVYFAYRNSVQADASRSGDVRAIAALHLIPLHLLAWPHIRSVTDLRNSTFLAAVGTPLEDLLFNALGISRNPAAVGQSARSPTDAARLVGEGVAHAAFVGAYYPAESVQAAINRGARLLPVEGAEIDRIRRENRFVRQVAIPANMYTGQPRAIHTIGVATVIVCRRDLDETVVYELTKRLFESLGALSETFAGLRAFDVEQTPATPVPLHQGAARYYRELELLR